MYIDRKTSVIFLNRMDIFKKDLADKIILFLMNFFLSGIAFAHFFTLMTTFSGRQVSRMFIESHCCK